MGLPPTQRCQLRLASGRVTSIQDVLCVVGNPCLRWSGMLSSKAQKNTLSLLMLKEFRPRCLVLAFQNVKQDVPQALPSGLYVWFGRDTRVFVFLFFRPHGLFSVALPGIQFTFPKCCQPFGFFTPRAFRSVWHLAPENLACMSVVVSPYLPTLTVSLLKQFLGKWPLKSKNAPRQALTWSLSP